MTLPGGDYAILDTSTVDVHVVIVFFSSEFLFWHWFKKLGLRGINFVSSLKMIGQ